MSFDRSTRTNRNHMGIVADVDADFSITDERGRAVGGWYQVVKVEFTPATAENIADKWFCGYAHPAGTFYELHFGNLRNGEQYQASKRLDTTLATLEEATAIGAKKLAEMRKRYARKYKVAA